MFKKLFNSGRAQKVFCIGCNKTGTTSLKQALKDLGYKVGNQAAAELLLRDYAQRHFQPIVDYCHSAEAFQDIPFSLPYTYQILDYTFPSAKFILSIRDSDEEWYQSLIRFHQNRLRLTAGPTKEDLLNDPYRYKGFIWEYSRVVYDSPEDDPFNEDVLKAQYRTHNTEVTKYFRHRDDLLVINLKEKDSYQKFCDFLKIEPIYEEFPYLNRSRMVGTLS